MKGLSSLQECKVWVNLIKKYFRENLDLFKPSIFHVREVIEEESAVNDSKVDECEDVDGGILASIVTASTEFVDLSDPSSLKRLVRS